MLFRSVSSSIPNWSISSSGCPLHHCTQASASFPDLNVVCTETADDPLQRFVVEVTAARSGSTIAFVLLIFFTNWLITLVIIWTTFKVRRASSRDSNHSPGLTRIPTGRHFPRRPALGFNPRTSDGALLASRCASYNAKCPELVELPRS